MREQGGRVGSRSNSASHTAKALATIQPPNIFTLLSQFPADLWLISADLCYISCSIPISVLFSMPPTRKRAPSSPKKASKWSRNARNQGVQQDLGGGMLVTSFQLEGKPSVNYRVHKLMLLSAPPADTLQAATAPCHVHFATDTVSAAPESSAGPLAGPSCHHGEE